MFEAEMRQVVGSCGAAKSCVECVVDFCAIGWRDTPREATVPVSRNQKPFLWFYRPIGIGPNNFACV